MGDHGSNYLKTATCKQVELLALACNQAMRIHIGQLADPLTVQLNFEIGYLRHHDGEPAPMEVQEKLEELSKLCWHGKSYGFYGMNYDEKSNIWWDMYQVFRYQIWKDSNIDASSRDMTTVASHEPMHTGKEPLILIEDVKN